MTTRAQKAKELTQELEERVRGVDTSADVNRIIKEWYSEIEEYEDPFLSALAYQIYSISRHQQKIADVELAEEKARIAERTKPGPNITTFVTGKQPFVHGGTGDLTFTGSLPNTGLMSIPHIIWRLIGSFVAVFLLTTTILYVEAWEIKIALIFGAIASALSIIFNPQTWHRRAALALLILMGTTQIGFGLYGHFKLSPVGETEGYIVLSPPAVIVEVLIIMAAVVIYVFGEIRNK